MNRFIFGRGWVYQDEATDGTEGGAGGAGGEGAPAGEGEGDGVGEGDDLDAAGEDGGAADAAGAAGKEQAPKDMKSAIDAALGYKAGKDGAGEQKPAAAKPAEKKPAAAAGTETDTAHANGKPKKNDKGEDLDAEGKVVKAAAPKVKTSAELDLKPDQLKLLKPETQARFREVIGALKEREGTIATLTDTNKTLTQARDAILGVMQETSTTQDELAYYLEFNALVKSGDPKKVEQALHAVEQQRLALYKALGKEPADGGIDLLADFPDLQKQVEDSEITRNAALEIANARRERAERQAAAQRDQKQKTSATQTAEQHKQASETALAAIEKWTVGLSKSDLDYKAKEDKLLAKVGEVLKSYPPEQWLSTLKLLYDGIAIHKAQPAAGGPRPLRPSGAKPGDKKPGDMLEAINQGLGYATAQKG